MKVALILGVDVKFDISYEKLVWPDKNDPEMPWRIKTNPELHPNHVCSDQVDLLVGAGGLGNHFHGYHSTLKWLKNGTLQKAHLTLF